MLRIGDTGVTAVPVGTMEAYEEARIGATGLSEAIVGTLYAGTLAELYAARLA